MRKFMVLVFASLFISIAAHADWIRQTYTYVVPGHYENVSVWAGYTYDSWGNVYNYYRWVTVWVDPYYRTDVRYVWVCR